MGDPAQLPPQLQGGSFTERSLGRPLMSRLATAGGLHPLLLDTQYRCHPLIARIPNVSFYQGRLRDGVEAEQRLPLVPGLPHLAFIDVSADAGRTNRAHQGEAEAAAAVVRLVLNAGVPAPSVCVCVFFHAQSQAIRSCFGGDGCPVDVATVDSFQGQERDVVVLSFCGPPAGGFATAERINVSLTRARTHLLVIGNSKSLPGEAWWAELLKASRKTAGGYVPVRSLPVRLPSAWGNLAPTPGASPPGAAAHLLLPDPAPAGGVNAAPTGAADDALPATAAAWDDEWSDGSWGGPGGAPPEARAAARRDAADDAASDEVQIMEVENEAGLTNGTPEGLDAQFESLPLTVDDLWDANVAKLILQYLKHRKADVRAFRETQLGGLFERLFPGAINTRHFDGRFIWLQSHAETWLSMHGADTSMAAVARRRPEELVRLRERSPSVAAELERQLGQEAEDEADLDGGFAFPSAACSPGGGSDWGTAAGPAEAAAAERGTEDYLY